MTNKIKIKNTIAPFNKRIKIEGDKSLSIRWALLASQSYGKSTSINLLKSEDVLNTLNCLKKLGVKINMSKNKCKIYGVGINRFNYKKKTILNAGNSGTLARLIMGLLVHTKNEIKIIGDESLSKRDFIRVIKPLEKFGAKFKSNFGKLPVTIIGTDKPKPIKYFENKGSAQCKSAVMLASINTKGETLIRAKKSRNHSELLFKHLKIPIKIKKINGFDIIRVNGGKKIKPLNYKIPSDISSAAFLIVLTALSKKSKLVITNVNVNPSRIGILKILRLMGIKVVLRKIKIYKGEKVANIHVESAKKIKSINCPPNLNSSTIDEFLIIFLLAARAKEILILKICQS